LGQIMAQFKKNVNIFDVFAAFCQKTGLKNR